MEKQSLFTQLKDEYNQRLKSIFIDDPESFSAFELIEVENKIHGTNGEGKINFDEFEIEYVQTDNDEYIQTNIAFEYSRIGDPLSGLDRFVGSFLDDQPQRIRLAQREAARWASSLTDEPSNNLIAFFESLYLQKS